MTRKLVSCWTVAAALTGAVFGSDLYFSDSTQQNNRWDYADGWKANSGTAGVLPTLSDTVTINSKYVDPAHPLEIREGVDARAHSLRLGTLLGESTYRGDGRVMALKMSGGTLRTDFDSNGLNWDGAQSLSIGDSQDGYGLFTLTGGLVSNHVLSVGFGGIGVVTNAGGRILLHDVSPESEKWYGGALNVGYRIGSTGLVVQTAGSIEEIRSSNIRIGHQGHGAFEWRGGDLKCPVRIGTGAGGLGEMLIDAGEGKLQNGLFIGDTAGATGIVTYVSGRLMESGIRRVGRAGCGRLYWNGAAAFTDRQHWMVGYEATGNGYMEINQPTPANQNSSLIAGLYGKGHVVVNCNVETGYLKVGGVTNSTGLIEIGQNGTVIAHQQVCVGGYAMNETDLPGQLRGGFGELRLHGGHVRIPRAADGSTAYLLIGRYEENFGRIVGFGSFEPKTDSETNLRMSLGRGQLVGDGEGQSASLDFHRIVSVTSLFGNPAEGTNGWFAVNKGEVLFPRTWFGNGESTVTRSVGTDGKREGDPDFVNSVKATVTGVTDSNNYFRGGVCATDRDDVHLEALPTSSVAPLGVWKLGLFKTLDGFDGARYNTVSLTFRYDQTKVPQNCQSLKLLRWNGSRWTKVGSVDPRTDTKRLVSTEVPLEKVSGSWNIGIFALQAARPGFVLVFR